jgi:histidinol phosphatase-like enzyme
MKIIFLDIDGVLNSDMYEANRTDKLDDNRIDHS